MKHKTKKLIAVSLALLSVAAIFFWYFFPVLMSKWFLYNSKGLEHYLNVRPTCIEKLPESSAEWANISIDKLVLKLPAYKYKKISGNENHLLFASDHGSLLIYDLFQTAEFLRVKNENNIKNPVVSYKEWLAIYQTVPADISFLSSRSKNQKDSMNLVLKAIALPVGGLSEVIVVNQKSIKAICILSEKKEKGFNAFVDIFNQNENVSFSMSLRNYKDSAVLNSDLLTFLGGIKIPNQPLNAVTVKNDIAAIIKRYKGTEQSNEL